VAEAAAVEGSGSGKRRGGILPKGRKRPGIRIDMTPMVDIAFLLLIFFMVTTVFRRPLAMEVNIPEPGATVAVPRSNVLTVSVLEDVSMRYEVGGGAEEGVAWEALPDLFTSSQASNPDLIVLVKIHPRAPYSTMVDMMDILDEAGIQRFSLIEMEGTR
jgi:biopolymer transport protein ExbD